MIFIRHLPSILFPDNNNYRRPTTNIIPSTVIIKRFTVYINQNNNYNVYINQEQASNVYINNKIITRVYI